MTEDQVETLLGELCVTLGFCLTPEGYEQIASEPPETPEAFARAVFSAEGLDYDADPRENLKDAVREMVRLHRGAAS